jgi:plastocyanin
MTARPARLFLAIAGVIPVVAACATPAASESSSPAAAAPEVAPVAMVLVAQDIAFSPAELHVLVGTPIALHFEHRDAGIPHGLVLQAPTNPPTPLFTAEVVTGPTTQDAVIPGLIAGAYRFTCQVHPNMSATLVVESS